MRPAAALALVLLVAPAWSAAQEASADLPTASDLLAQARRDAQPAPTPESGPAEPAAAAGGPSRVYFFDGAPIPLPFALGTVDRLRKHVERLKAERHLDV